MIPLNANKEMVTILKEFVANVRSTINDPKHRQFPKEELLEIIKIVDDKMTKSTGLKFYFSLLGTDWGLGANAYVGADFLGHVATELVTSKIVSRESNKNIKIEDTLDLEIDLQKLHIKGTLVSGRDHIVGIGMAHFIPKINISDDEIVAILLHEVGHVFSTYIHLGDYVWINHYLTEGIEILQGKKQSKVKTEVYSENYLKKHLTEKELQDFIYGKLSETDARKVALIMARDLPRQHLVDNKISAIKGEERFADLFAARLGFTKAYASGYYKTNKLYGITKQSTTSRLTRLTLTSIFSVGIIPVVYAVASLFDSLPENFYTEDKLRYDNDHERISKMKRELVFQLKQTTDLKVRKQLEKEVTEVNEILKFMGDNRKIYDDVRTFMRHGWRRGEQLLKQESVLEELANNDLYVKATRII